MLSRADLLRATAEQIALALFLSMLNPLLRGRCFDYRTFDITRYVRSKIGTQISWRPDEEDLRLASEHARIVWDRWVEMAGDGIPARTS